MVMGGNTEPVTNALKESYTENAELADALHIAVDALKQTDTGNGNEPRQLDPATLEVAILDANRPKRAFRRINRAMLDELLPGDTASDK